MEKFSDRRQSGIGLKQPVEKKREKALFFRTVRNNSNGIKRNSG